MKPMTDLLFELEAILKNHAKRNPLMQPRDTVKLIYQNAFGGGHLIWDEEACLNCLRREYADLEKDPTASLYEDIGNGIVRVNLAAVKPEDLERLGIVDPAPFGNPETGENQNRWATERKMRCKV